MKSVLGAFIGLACIASTLGQTTVVLYAEDFGGSSTADLHGTAPDTRPDSETWITATGASAWQADGSISNGGSANALLPFTPESGYVYTLQASLNPNAPTNSDDWFAIGFARNANVTTGFQLLETTAWMLGRVRRDSNGDIQTFLGPDTASGTNHSSAVGTLGFKVVLDTTGSQWTAEWFLNDSSLRSVAFSSQPTINYVGLGRLGSAVGSFSSFSLSATSAVPEPSTWALVLGLVALGAAIRRRRTGRSN